MSGHSSDLWLAGVYHAKTKSDPISPPWPASIAAAKQLDRADSHP